MRVHLIQHTNVYYFFCSDPCVRLLFRPFPHPPSHFMFMSVPFSSSIFFHLYFLLSHTLYLFFVTISSRLIYWKQRYRHLLLFLLLPDVWHSVKPVKRAAFLANSEVHKSLESKLLPHEQHIMDVTRNLTKHAAHNVWAASITATTVMHLCSNHQLSNVNSTLMRVKMRERV